MKKVNIFCHLFQKWSPLYYIDSLHIWNISSLYFLKFWWLWLTDNENPKSKVRILHTINKVCSFLCTQYLVGPPFAWITASVWRGMEAISLWHCSGVMEAQVALIAAFRSSALLVSLIFLLIIPHWFSMGFRSGEFAGQSSTVTWSLNQLLVNLAVWAGAKSCWKMKSASP